MNRTGILIAGSIASLFFATCAKGSGDYDAMGVYEATEIVVSSETMGRLVEFEMEEGQSLNFGEVLGYVDTTQLALQRKQLAASLNAVQSRRADVSKQISALQEQIKMQKREQQRVGNLLKVNAATQKQLDDVTSNIAVLESQLLAQKEVLERTNAGVSSESIAIQAQIEQLDDQLARSIVVSPIAGTVLSKYAQAGEFVQPGKPLFKVADLSRLYMRAYVDASVLTRVAIGQSAKLYADVGESDRREYEGRVTWISDRAEFTPKTIQTRDERANLVYAVKIAVENEGYIKRGMYGEVKFEQ